MNIIEQLGGYSAAKAKLESLNGQFYKTMEPERFLFEMDNQQKLSVIISALEIAMLEYRRQHNIFEVLDLIMYENKLYEIKYIYHPEKARITDGLQGRTVYDFPRGIRHATDAEIKAGKRL